MDNYLTEEGLEKLKKELEYLKTIKRREIAERLKHAASFGDLKENAAYDEAKDAQAFLQGRILELGKLIKTAIIIKNEIKDRVRVGTSVTIARDFDKKKTEKERYTIVGQVEADPFVGKISADSPLGKNLLNLKEGDIFKVETPEGKIEYKVIKIE